MGYPTSPVPGVSEPTARVGDYEVDTESTESESLYTETTGPMMWVGPSSRVTAATKGYYDAMAINRWYDKVSPDLDHQGAPVPEALRTFMSGVLLNGRDELVQALLESPKVLQFNLEHFLKSIERHIRQNT